MPLPVNLRLLNTHMYLGDQWQCESFSELTDVTFICDIHIYMYTLHCYIVLCSLCSLYLYYIRETTPRMKLDQALCVEAGFSH